MQKGKNKDLLKEAIADAKAVRETALKNAKLALEEAFTPKLQSMLSAKLQKEVEGDDEEIEDVDIDVTEEPVDGEEDVDIELDADDEFGDDEEIDEEEVSSEIGTQEFPAEQPETEDPGEGELTEDDEELDLDIEDDETPIEEPAVEPETEDELDLEAIIRELDDENNELEADVEFEEEPEVTEEEEPITEPAPEVEDDDDEEIDISMTELYKALKEIEGEDLSEPYDAPGAPEVEPAAIEEEEETELQAKVDDLEQEKGELEKELGEAYKVVKFLKSKLNEVNLINAKLLFTTKLFRAFDLSQPEKIKVVETLDRANNAREAKLVFVTLAESYGKGKAKKVNKPVKKLTENIARASKTQLTTKPKPEILSESDDMVARFRKLANITKK